MTNLMYIKNCNVKLLTALIKASSSRRHACCEPLCLLFTVFFLPRDAMHKRGLSVARSVRLSVLLYLPVTFVYCTHTAEDIVKLHPRPGNPIMLVFLTSSACIQFLGNHFSGAQNTWGGKICDYRLKSQFISEAVRDRPMVVMER